MMGKLFMFNKSLIIKVTNLSVTDIGQILKNNFTENFLMIFQLTYLVVSTSQDLGCILSRQFVGGGNKTLLLIKLECIF